MEKKIFVSVLIINYNNAKFLKRSIKSCLNQNYENLEILIYDDKSTDKSEFLLKKYKKNKKINYFINKSKKTNIPSIDASKGYYKLINKCRGEIIFLLDSDDYFIKDKIQKIIKIFNSNKKINYIQDLPLIFLDNKKKIYKKFANNAFSFWPYFSPTSCISFRRKFIKKFIKSNYLIQNKYNDLWLDFRLGAFSYYIDKSFYCFRENLTCYKPLGASKKYPFLSSNWIFRRNYSFEYLKEISKNKINYKLSFDYHVTKFFFKIKNVFLL